VLVSTKKSTVYQLVVLMLTLLISTTITKQAFSVRNIVKTGLHNKIEDEFLTDCLIFYIGI
jgi:hypothetical protein